MTVVFASVAVCADTLRPDIRADTNRDGVIDMLGASDRAPGKTTLFLPNIDDSARRCAFFDACTAQPLSDAELASCHDAAGDDDKVHVRQYLAPVRTTRLADVSDDAVGTVAALPEEHDGRVRVFRKVGGAAAASNNSSSSISSGWRRVYGDMALSSRLLRAGMQLGLDARELVTDAERSGWNGSIRLRFSVSDGSVTAFDEVAFELAPVLLYHHGQRVDTLVAASGDGIQTSRAQAAFLAALNDARRSSKIDKPLVLLNATASYMDPPPADDNWAQDYFEPVYASMSGLAASAGTTCDAAANCTRSPSSSSSSSSASSTSSTVPIRIMLRSPQALRYAGRQLFAHLCGPGVGVANTGLGYGFRQVDSMGNLETIPPYTLPASGRRYPAGRAVLARKFGAAPDAALLRFLAAQRVQGPPLLLEASWLAVGHVDEIVSFLPLPAAAAAAAAPASATEGGVAFVGVDERRADNASRHGANENGIEPRRWTIAVADVDAGLDVLRRAQRARHASVRAFSKYPEDDRAADGPSNTTTTTAATSNTARRTPPATYLRVEYYQRNITIDELLASTAFLAAQRYARRHIAANLQTLLAETGVPSLYREGPAMTVAGLYEPPPPTGEMRLLALYPSAINAVVVSAAHVIVPRSWGPVVQGVGILGDAVRSA